MTVVGDEDIGAELIVAVVADVLDVVAKVVEVVIFLFVLSLCYWRLWDVVVGGTFLAKLVQVSP